MKNAPDPSNSQDWCKDQLAEGNEEDTPLDLVLTERLEHRTWSGEDDIADEDDQMPRLGHGVNARLAAFAETTTHIY